MKTGLKQTWRWYGPNDSVTLNDIKQAGATGIVSALHYMPHGEAWPVEDIQKRKNQIEAAGLSWDVVESVNVHEAIKTRQGNYKDYIEKYKQTLRNLASVGIKTVCYNFMPVLDWTRTQLDYELPNGAKALRFDWIDLAVFDRFILKRKDAEADYSDTILKNSEERFNRYSKDGIELLTQNILMGVPSEKPTTTQQILESVRLYKEIGRQGLRENMAYFLENIMDTCEENGMVMTVHPDDPPIQILGLPRIVSGLEDIRWLMKKVDRKPNGLCFCTGSLGAGKQNDLVQILEETGDRVYFVHLRNVKMEANGNFYESDHLDGRVDMYAVMRTLLKFQAKREEAIPYRPDHGHQMLDDLQKTTFPGYSAIGRLKGLAELRGLEMGIKRTLEAQNNESKTL